MKFSVKSQVALKSNGTRYGTNIARNVNVIVSGSGHQQVMVIPVHFSPLVY